MELREIRKDDLPICLEYLREEWEYITGSNKGSDKLALKMEAAMMDEPGMVVLIDGVLVGFAVIEEGKDAIMLVSFYVAKGFRSGTANYLLMKYVMDLAGTRSIAYCSLHKEMTLPKSVCKNESINKDVVNKWLNATSSRFDKE